MSSPADRRLIADAADRAIQRLEAALSGDHEAVARLDATAQKDQRSTAALWSVAFGIAERSLSVIRSRLGEQEMRELLQSFRKQTDEYRHE